MTDRSISFWQKSISLPAMKRGFHIIQQEIDDALNEMPNFSLGLLNVFIQHTSASICISENTCKDVRDDLEKFFMDIAPDDFGQYQHNLEGVDDMPAHIKNVIIGSSLTVPINQGKLNLGQWQGIYLCEHRINPGRRMIILTAHGQL